MAIRPTSAGNTRATSGCAWIVLVGGIACAALFAAAAYYALR